MIPPPAGVHTHEPMYLFLDSQRILTTTDALRARISERFPRSGLSRVADELLALARESAAHRRWLARPVWGIRVLVVLTCLLLIGVAIGTFLALDRSLELSNSVADFLQGLDAVLNEIILVGVAIFFLLSWETRLKRRRALQAIRELRSIAHVVDMHQLTKDPESVQRVDRERDTLSSPTRALDAFALTRYLDYCSELLSLISKIAALHVQEFDDPVTLATVGDLQDLCGGLSQKIWQKIMIVGAQPPGK